MNNLNQNTEDFIIGQKFVLEADVIFLANLSNEQFQQLDSKKYKVISKNNQLTSFKVKELEINEWDTIYCSSNNIELLFYYLKKIPEVKNLTLISGQSDRTIDKKIFMKKPNSIIRWYSTNVNYIDSSLIPIPLGIANDYSPKNLRRKDFINKKNNAIKKENFLYVNMKRNTNEKERASVYEYFKNREWAIVKKPNLTLQDYQRDLSQNKFVLCPWGNGYDTHRLWETLYSGSFPVTKFHPTYSSFKNLPIIFVNNYEDIDLNFLLSSVENLNTDNLEELSFEYWKNKINSNRKFVNTKSIVVGEDKIYEKVFWTKKYYLYKFQSKKKILAFYLKKLVNFFYNPRRF